VRSHNLPRCTRSKRDATRPYAAAQTGHNCLYTITKRLLFGQFPLSLTFAFCGLTISLVTKQTCHANVANQDQFVNLFGVTMAVTTGYQASKISARLSDTPPQVCFDNELTEIAIEPSRTSIYINPSNGTCA
jgi:hypothetical protein